MQIDPASLDRIATYRLMISTIVPRPIAWVSTLSKDGVANAAPFSYFQALGGKPPMLMIAVGRRRGGDSKDTAQNIADTGEFVVNVVSEDAGAAMVMTSVDYPPETSEFDEVGLEAAPSVIVKTPRIAQCKVAMECKLDRVLDLAGSAVCVGRIVLFHVADGLMDENGTVDPHKLRPLGRLGGSNYLPLRDVLAITQDGSVATVPGDRNK
ncbi:MAG: flavin reductase family protein [Planctomycetota bacterium]|nr:flavin reductase family protein [Planctomycetota bacterium]